MVANLYDERHRTRRRIEALRPPHALSAEALAYQRDEYGARQPQPEPKEIPLYFVGVFSGAFWTAFAVLVVLAWWAAN